MHGDDAVSHRHVESDVRAEIRPQHPPIDPLAIAVVAPVEQGLLAALVSGQHDYVAAVDGNVLAPIGERGSARSRQRLRGIDGAHIRQRRR